MIPQPSPQPSHRNCPTVPQLHPQLPRNHAQLSDGPKRNHAQPVSIRDGCTVAVAPDGGIRSREPSKTLPAHFLHFQNPQVLGGGSKSILRIRRPQARHLSEAAR